MRKTRPIPAHVRGKQYDVFFSGGKLRWAFKSKDLGRHLISSTSEADLDLLDNLRSYLNLARQGESVNGLPRLITRRTIKTLNGVSERNVFLRPDDSAAFQAKLKLAR